MTSLSSAKTTSEKVKISCGVLSLVSLSFESTPVSWSRFQPTNVGGVWSPSSSIDSFPSWSVRIKAPSLSLQVSVRSIMVVPRVASARTKNSNSVTLPLPPVSGLTLYMTILIWPVLSFTLGIRLQPLVRLPKCTPLLVKSKTFVSYCKSISASSRPVASSTKIGTVMVEPRQAAMFSGILSRGSSPLATIPRGESGKSGMYGCSSPTAFRAT